jgi:exopolysaccharide biosynthesis WecB/TagA/CpsF family protein
MTELGDPRITDSSENHGPGRDPSSAITATDERVLGISFFNGDVRDAVDHLKRTGGFMVVPASPALLKLNHDESYRHALQQADLALADSALLTILWKIATGRTLRKISGLAYLKCLLEREISEKQSAFWVVSSEAAKTKADQWLHNNGYPVTQDDFYVAPHREGKAEDYELLLQIEKRQPRHVVIATGTRTQERLGLYLRDYLHDQAKPNIHCVGAALGFLTGEEPAVPEWAEGHYLGWLFRLASQPRMFLPRLGIACALTAMVFKYRSELPALKDRWVDL